MPILPSGKKRIMENQPSLGIGDTWGIHELGQQNDYPMPTEDIYTDRPETDKRQKGKPDLYEYIFSLLEGFGYPPRRLEEFSDNFVEEEFFPGEVKEVTVTLPDRYYGTRKRISDEDLSKIIEDIQSKFNLVLNKASRKDKKIIAEFIYQPTTGRGVEQDGEELSGKADDLDEIFGPSREQKQKKKLNRKRTGEAMTMQEMLKENKANMIDKLIEAAGKVVLNKQDTTELLQDGLKAKIINAFLDTE